MKIKHWQGYGSVNAKKVSSRTFKNLWEQKRKELVIEVWGNHEWGLERNDCYDVFNWLVKRFDKSVTDYNKIVGLSTKVSYQQAPNSTIDEEHCVYTIIIDEE